MLKKIAILVCACAALIAQEPFKVSISRWSTELPAPLRGVIPASPYAASGATVVVEILTEDPMDAIVITLRYERDGKKLRRSQVTFPARHGCSPEPCRWAVTQFNVGDIDVSTATATVTPLVWQSVEEQ